MWQPEPPERQRSGAGSQVASGRAADRGELGTGGALPRRRSGRVVASWLILAIGLGGLAVAAVGIAHQLLPRRFTPSQQRAIAAWEVKRRWRALPAGKIFPAWVPYRVSAIALESGSSLALRAERLGISPRARCTVAVTGPAVAVLRAHDCLVALRSTYVDASGGMVATIAVAVLPSAPAARAAAAEISLHGDERPALVRALAMPGTPAAAFRTSQSQLSIARAAGPYVVMATAGFSDGRRTLPISADSYLQAELAGLDDGLVRSATQVLGAPPPPPRCPGAPGC